MTETSEYVLEPLREGSEFILYRGRKHGNPSRVLAVALAAQQPSPLGLRRLEHEYSLAGELDPAWAAKPLELARHEGRTILVLTDPGGEPLDQLLDRNQGQPLDPTCFLRIAIGLAAALGQTHRHGLIHKDIKPGNALVDDAGDVWLTGFGIASRLPRESPAPAPPEIIAGTLAYMAPEQTGRMNRSIDARSDLYSLGVTLYRMLTGTLPFAAADPLEWVHCHIARQPVPPGDRAAVPELLSAIVMKLLAKNAEERYQTAAGLEADLRRCLAEWHSHAHINSFALGVNDSSDRLLIPEKLYGREAEIDALLAAFDRVVRQGTTELVLVSGYSGIGKSSVVNELHKVLVPPRGLFASGKFDQYKRNIPYATVAQAFQGLVCQLLSKNDAELAHWRSALLEALGGNGLLMVNLIPELAVIVGEQPAVAELPPQEAQHRFQLLFRRFIGVFARAEHPLALFLDDLQWLDKATLDLIEHLGTHPEVRHLLLVGAYRDNEVGPSHPLMRTLGLIRSTKAAMQEIVLAPLKLRDMEHLVVDALRCDRAMAQPLVQLLHEKTGGNPFFTIQFLTLLAEEALLTFDHGATAWTWDMPRIRAKGFTENVVDFMATKLRRLPDTTRDFLGKLACVGNSAETATLSMVFGVSEDEIHGALWEVVRAGLISRLDGAYFFLHDRVQEAAYALVSEDRRPAVHLQIGRILTARTLPVEIEKKIFEIVNQLDRGAALIQSPEERQQVADLNLLAGKRARTATAYASALTYFAAGRTLLGDDCWERQYPLVFDLELHLAECEFLTGEYTSAEKRLSALLGRAATVVHRAAVTRLRQALYLTLDRPDRAIDVGLEYLRHVGIEWSQQPSHEDVCQELKRMWQLLDGRAIEQLIDLPLMSDLRWRATMDVFSGLFAPTLLTDSNLYDLVVLRMTTLSLEHGHCDASCYAYSHINRVLGFRFGDYQTALRFGQLACDLVESHGLDRFEARVYAALGAFAIPWVKDLSASRTLIRRGFDMANASGDLTYAVFGFKNLITNLLVSGEPLVDVEREAEQGLAFARKARFGFAIDWFTAQLMLIRALRGSSSAFDSAGHAGYGDLSFERRLKEDPPLALCTCSYWIHKLQACVLAQDHPDAIEAAANASALIWSTRSFLEAADYHFYGALTQAAVCDSSVDEERVHHFKALLEHHRQLTVWAENCSETFGNRAELVSAEIARLEGRQLDAMRFYEASIRSARQHRFIQNEGIANELAARFYAARDFETIANTYLRNARYCYLRWGAYGKVSQLEDLYPHLREEASIPALENTITVPTKLLDLDTVIKVSQALSGEMVLEKLIDRLMCAALQHAGAERGLLVLPDCDQLVIEAEARSAGSNVVVNQRNASASSTMLPESVVRYVLRTQQSVIVEDATSQNPFFADPYILQYRVRSILCLPLINQGKLTRVLYLENNLSPHVFTPGRVSVLQVLASQAAISLDNTRLYRDLEDRERKIRRLIDSNIIGIVIWGLDGRLLDANDAFLRMVRYDREDLKAGLGWFEMTPPEWQEVHARYEAEELKATGMMQAREKEYFRKDGSRVPVLIGAACFEGRPDQGVAYILDLSEQKRAEAALRSSEAALRSSEAYLTEAQRQTHTGSCALDGASGETVYWSAEMFHLFGFDPEQDPPKWEQFLERIHPEDRQKVNLASETMFRTKANCDVEFRIVKPDGTIKHIHGIGQPVLDPAGQLAQVLGTMVDVTEHKHAEEARDRVRQLEADLAHITRVSTIGEMAASLAHEIKQPIGAAVTNGEACVRLIDRDEPDLPEAREAALEMIKDARRAADIVDRVRSLYQKGPSQLQAVDVNEAIEEMAYLMGPEANRYSVTIRTDLENALPKLLADRVQLQQVLMNLMLNGIEAMQGTGRELRTTSQLTPDGQILISVSDSGVGLPEQDINRIFDAFFTTKTQGTGLGLAIARSVIQSHGGRIWA
ncbi:MAG TPA: AAA family ATPase, partial [Bryobacteraceae bacterium]|nr:AAA family ATPase [Bryobacteraceae bacterium]